MRKESLVGTVVQPRGATGLKPPPQTGQNLLKKIVGQRAQNSRKIENT